MRHTVSAAVVVLSLFGIGITLAPGAGGAGQLDPLAQSAVERYVYEAASQGKEWTHQGVWLQAGQSVLGEHQGSVPLPAASLTKVATTLAAIRAWGPSHAFVTMLYATGPIHGGVLQGDLVVYGGADPFFLWEDAIQLGNTLHRLGLVRVAGRLVVVGDFHMNFVTDAVRAGEMLRKGMHAGRWPKGVLSSYHTLPSGTPKPLLTITGPVQAAAVLPEPLTPLVRHHSLPLVQILKRMNVYSNNAMATMLAYGLGGPGQMMSLVSQTAGIPPYELQLINGSGLGRENQISPRAICAMFIAIHQLLQPARLTIADVFPTAGYDAGTIRRRQLPPLTIVKTGTLSGVSTLAGVMPTQQYGPVWFALLNQGANLDALRDQQDFLLQYLQQFWGTVGVPPTDFAPTFVSLGETERDNILMQGQDMRVQEARGGQFDDRVSVSNGYTPEVRTKAVGSRRR